MMQQQREVDGRDTVWGRARANRLRRGVVGLAVIAGLAAVSACTSVAPAGSGASQASSASGVTVYGTVDAGISHTRR